MARPRCSSKGGLVDEPEARRDQRVVSEHRVRVERQVVGGQAHVRGQQRAQPIAPRADDARVVPAPEHPVVGDDQLRAGLDRALEQFKARRYARGDVRDVRAALYLEAVRSVVAERLDVEQAVELRDDFVQQRHRNRTVADPPLWDTALPRGVAQPGSAHRSGR